MLVKKPDAFLFGPYLEQGGNGLKTVGMGSINAYHVHSFGHSNRGFYLSGASFSQLTSCYSDTCGGNGWEVSYTSSGLTMVDCWSFKSGQLIANSAQMQFYQANNVKLIGCRMSTPGAAGTSESIRFSGGSGSNQVDLIGCWSDQKTSSFSSPNTMSGCTGLLQKYSRGADQYISSAQVVGASSSVVSTTRIKTDSSIISPGFKAYDIRLTYRSSSGGVLVGVEDSTIFILNGISGPSNVVSRFPSNPLLPLSLPEILNTSVNLSDLSVTVTNADSTRNFQYSLEIKESATSRGYF